MDDKESKEDKAKAKKPPPEHDYSDRSGFPGGVEAARGAAAEFMAPEDMRIPKPLRPRPKLH